MKLGESIVMISQEIDEVIRISDLIEKKDYVRSFLRKYGNEVILEMLNNGREKLIKKYNSKKKADRDVGELLQDLKINTYTDPKKINGLLLHICEFLKKPKIKRTKDFSLDFYELTLREFLINEHANLQKLLLNVDVEEKSYTTLDFLHLIIDKRSEYNVSIESIKVFYELFWFKRLTNEEYAVIGKKMDENLIVELQKLPQKSAVIESVKKDKESDTKKPDFADKQKNEKDLVFIKRLDSLEMEVKKIETLFKTTESIAQNAKTKNNDFEYRLSKLEKSLIKIENNFEIITKKIQEDFFESKKNIIIDFDQKNENLKTQIYKKYDEALLSIDSRIIDSIEQSKRELLKINLDTASLPIKGEKLQNIKTEATFLRYWINYLSENYEIALNIEEAIVYHSIFKTLSYIVLDKFNIARSWIEVLGFEEDVRIESASPLWMNRLDWLGLSSFLEGSRKNKIGVISNYNVAITEAYLIPQLSRWMISTQHKSHKVFLISTVESKDKIDNKEIYSIAGTLPRHELYKFKSIKNLSTQEVFSISKGMPKINLEAYLKWIQPRSKESLRDVVVDITFKKFKIEIPEMLYENFMNLLSNLEIYFSFIEAVEIALDSALKSYIDLYYSEEKYEQFKSSVLGVLENE